MGIPVKLQVFEGPLDLLLHLIEKNKVNIYDIPIVEITDQYMEYIHAMEREDLNIMSEFMVMAATLISIKCKMLLPKEVNEEGEEEAPEKNWCASFWNIKCTNTCPMSFAIVWQQRQKMYTSCQLFRKRCWHTGSRWMPKELLDGLTLKKLNDIFQSVMRRQEDKVDPIRSKFGKIEKEEVSLPDKMKEVGEYARFHRYFGFRDLLSRQASKVQVIVTFLAILELMKMGIIRISQRELFDEIEIESLQEEG